MADNNIAHVTTAHPRFDVRIFHKEVKSLSKDFIVSLLVADGKGSEWVGKIQIVDIGKPKSRGQRMFLAIFRMMIHILRSNARTIHFHDPELLIIVPFLKLFGRRVIYDAHENVHKQILSKTYLSPIIRIFASKLFFYFETLICLLVDGIVCATPGIALRFVQFGSKVTTINNYPLPEELFKDLSSVSSDEKRLAYVGVITRERGIIELIAALGILQTKYELHLAGSFENEELLAECRAMPGWKRVIYHGLVERHQIQSILRDSLAGIVTFLAAPNHIESQPNKMFEYMSASLPIICSNFSKWQEHVDTWKCGITVDPSNPNSIAEGIDKLLKDPLKCKMLGENGRRAVIEKFNWENEEYKLRSFYNRLIYSNAKTI